MMNSIMEAVSTNLKAEFGCEVYLEDRKQELMGPCFFIVCVNSAIKRFHGKRYIRQNQLCIRYLPESLDRQRECIGVAERMNWCLEYVIFDDSLIRGTKMKYEITDGALGFYVNYDCFVHKMEENTAMETMNTVLGEGR